MGGSLPRGETSQQEKQNKINKVNINPTKDNELPELNKEDLVELDNLLKKQKKKANEANLHKKVLFKKESIERNRKKHPEVDIKEYNRLVGQALYNRTYITPGNKDGYFIFYGSVDSDHYSNVAIDIQDTPESYAIAHIHLVRKKSIDKKQK